MTAPDASRRCHAVWLSGHGKRFDSPWKWSEPYATAREAKDRAQAELAAGNGSLAYVVGVDGAVKKILAMYPASAASIIQHHQEFLELLAE